MKPSDRHRILILTAIAWVLAATSAAATEEARYEVIETFPDFELRRYEPFLIVETTASGDFDDVATTAFRRLAGYLFGKNERKEQIEMRMPIRQRPAAAHGNNANRYRISFVLPSRYTLSSLPRPLIPQVTLRQEPAKLVAARRYSGSWTQTRYRENESQLLAATRRAGMTAVDAPVYARYNSRFSLWFFRRNEVMVEISARQK